MLGQPDGQFRHKAENNNKQGHDYAETQHSGHDILHFVPDTQSLNDEQVHTDRRCDDRQKTTPPKK